MKSTTDNLTCYLCGNSNCSLIHDTIRYNLAPRPYQCNTCGFIFLYPRMTPDEEKEFYDMKYRFYYENQPAEDLWRDSLPEAKRRVLKFKDLYSNQTCLLEIGCASGFFLHEVRDFVKTASGVELTDTYVKYAVSKGLDVKKSLNEIPDGSYDLIFMFHVLEHIVTTIHEVKKMW